MFNNSMNLIVTLYFDKVVNLFVYSFRYPSYKLTNTTRKSTSTSGKWFFMIIRRRNWMNNWNITSVLLLAYMVLVVHTLAIFSLQNNDTGEEPLYVNAKQYHRILKRRQARAKLEALGRIPKERQVLKNEITRTTVKY